MIDRRKMKYVERKNKIETECQEWAKAREKPKERWMVKECDIFLSCLCHNKTEKIAKRKHDLITLFDNWKDRIPIPITEWGGNFLFNDDAETKR